ncbi:MAG: transporter ATP-binding protein [Parcubacteria group bacterium]|nr:transporter ATP-binding protein [Parcubacteria group bacterium]
MSDPITTIATHTKEKKPSIFSLLAPYKAPVLALALLAISTSGLGLILPKIISHGIDDFVRGSYVERTVIIEFSIVILGIFITAYLQSIVQVYTSERVAKDLRNTFADKISRETYAFVEKITPSKLLTNLTADIDSIKMFIGQAIASLISSAVIVIGAGALLISINWKLGLTVLAIVPVIGGMFYFIFSRVRVLMKKSREIIDRLNKVINESVLGASLIRVLHSHGFEAEKFSIANTDAKGLGIRILKMFAALIPVITFVANLATLAILALGGKFIIEGSMTLGDFSAFQSYVGLFIFPLLLLGVMSSVMSQASASYERIREVLESTDPTPDGTVKKELEGNIAFRNVVVKYGEKPVLKDISFSLPGHTKTAIIGPTAAGKTQMLYLLTGLSKPTSGTVEYDSTPIADYESESLHRQIGFVFQDSIIFNLTLRENIAFGDAVTEASMDKAIRTAELGDFMDALPLGMETIVSERGSSLSGGQKQRIMLARALALDPKILLLDDFTARVDQKTERKILDNIAREYPDITLVSVTQKISSVEKYDKIIVIMEGELIAEGTHTELLSTSPEYVQIFDSQKSTNNYE